MGALDKNEATKGQRQYHIHLSEGDIGEYVLLPGDPARSDIVAKFLDDPKLMANHREHRTITGYYKGVKISVTSTGMGCPSTAIAAEELIHIGAKALIRIGSCAALDQRIKIGDIVISLGAMKNEGTSRFYVPDIFPAVPDYELNHCLIQTAKEMLKEKEQKLYMGINSSNDAFYGETPEFLEGLRKLNVMHMEMESSALYTIGHIRGVRTACICGASSNLTNSETIYTTRNEKLETAWEVETQIVLETIYRFEQEKKSNII